jgi:hypothetical protein
MENAEVGRATGMKGIIQMTSGGNWGRHTQIKGCC